MDQGPTLGPSNTAKSTIISFAEIRSDQTKTRMLLGLTPLMSQSPDRYQGKEIA